MGSRPKGLWPVEGMLRPEEHRLLREVIETINGEQRDPKTHLLRFGRMRPVTRRWVATAMIRFALEHRQMFLVWVKQNYRGR